jgi:hypothetical protein
LIRTGGRIKRHGSADRPLQPDGKEGQDQMELWNIILNAITLAVVGAVSLFVKMSTGALEAGVKTSAEEGARTAIKNINWPEALRQELEKSRGVERQELRFKSYGQLWSLMRPLAIYSKEHLNRENVAKLSDSLSDWYFSDCGGMLMTSHVREFYFALQDLVRSVGSVADDWQSQRVYDDQRSKFEGILRRMNLEDALEVRKKLSNADVTSWPSLTTDDCKRWRTAVKALGDRWSELDEREKFVVLQQVGSVLRTNLAHDVESRLR